MAAVVAVERRKKGNSVLDQLWEVALCMKNSYSESMETMGDKGNRRVNSSL